jgi:hypothetical protein
MELDTLIKKIMLDIKVEGIIPDKYHYYIRKRIPYIYAAGVDSIFVIKKNNGCKRPVVQLGPDKKYIDDFPSVKHAIDTLGIPKSTILLALANGHMTRHGHYWMYKEDYENYLKKSE